MRRIYGRIALVVMFVWSVALGAIAPALAQESHVPGGHAQVIASGIDQMPRVDVAWRVTANTARPGDEAEFFRRTLGFVVAQDEPVLVTDGATGNAALIDAGQASFHPEGTSQRRSSVSDDDTDYLSIELIVASEVDDEETLGSADLLFAGDGFEAPRGTRDVRLTRDILAPAEEGSFSATSDAPYLFHVTAGAIQVTDEDGDITEFAAGDSAEFTGDIEILAGARSGGTWLAASIGEEVEVPPLPTREADETGTLEMRLEVCPDGFDEACEPDVAREVVPLAFHHVDNENWIIPDRAAWSEDDTVLTYEDLPVGDYTTGPEEESQPNTRGEGAGWNNALAGWEWEIEADEITVIRVQLDTSASETGALLVTLYDCGEDVSDDSGCELAEEAWPIWIAPPDGGVDDARWLDEDAEEVGSSEYLFDNLPAGTWDLSPDEDGPDGPVEIVVDGDAYEIPGLWAVDIEAGETAEVRISRWVPDGAGEQTGALFVTLYDCPAGTDPTADTSACEVTSEPWDVAVDLVGQSDVTTWSLYDDAIDLGDGEFWFELLPATSLILRPSPEGHEVYVGGDPYLLGDDTWAVDIPAQDAAYASLYRVLEGDGGGDDPQGGTGSLVIEQVDCEYGTDPSVDTSTCALSTSPWEVTLTNTSTGDTFSMTGDGWAHDSGTWVLEALPAGNYSIGVHSNDNWDIYGPSSVDVTADDETYITIYSVDRRAP